MSSLITGTSTAPCHWSDCACCTFHRLLTNLNHNADQIAHSAVVVTPHGTDLVLDSHVSHNETRVRVLHFSDCSSTVKEQTESGVEVATVSHHSQQVVVIIICLKRCSGKKSHKRRCECSRKRRGSQEKGSLKKKGEFKHARRGLKNMFAFFMFLETLRVLQEKLFVKKNKRRGLFHI